MTSRHCFFGTSGLRVRVRVRVRNISLTLTLTYNPDPIPNLQVAAGVEHGVAGVAAAEAGGHRGEGLARGRGGVRGRVGLGLR